jgi:hypothetical protein
MSSVMFSMMSTVMLMALIILMSSRCARYSAEHATERECCTRMTVLLLIAAVHELIWH